jgi:hypothetical protein
MTLPIARPLVSKKRRPRATIEKLLNSQVGYAPHSGVMVKSPSFLFRLAERIAAPMVSGLVTSSFLELTVYPAGFTIWKSRSLPSIKPSSGQGAPP